MSFDVKVQGFLSQISLLDTMDQLEQACLTSVRELDFTSVAYFRLYGGGRTHSGTYLFGQGCSEWVELYAQRGFAGRDPCNMRAFRTTSAFTWDEASGLAPSAAAAEVFAEARRVAGADGLVTPVRSGVDELGVCVLYAAQKITASSYERLLLQGVCDAFSRRGLQLLKGEVEEHAPSLTVREAECLRLVASGHSDQEIATVLDRSFNTVHSHVESLRSKLRARSRAQLVLRAAMAGLLPV